MKDVKFTSSSEWINNPRNGGIRTNPCIECCFCNKEYLHRDDPNYIYRKVPYCVKARKKLNISTRHSCSATKKHYERN